MYCIEQYLVDKVVNWRVILVEIFNGLQFVVIDFNQIGEFILVDFFFLVGCVLN